MITSRITQSYATWAALLSLGAASLCGQGGSLERSAETGSEREMIVPREDSNVFGANLFTPGGPAASFSAFNPEYRVQIGDLIRIQIWGATTFNEVLTVDAQGNIFLPEIGPILVAGTSNQSLNEVISNGIAQIYTRNVNLYANLETSQQVKVYVAGFVLRPGLYGGLASENLINYLALAGGIDLRRGSLTRIDVKRGEATRISVNLYDFLTQGNVPLIQFADGDVIFVHPLANTVEVSGLARNAFQFEFSGNAMPGSEIIRLAQPDPLATHVVIKRSRGATAEVITTPIANLPGLTLQPGDRIEFSADRKKDTILVKIEGEHDGDGALVLPYGATLGDLYEQMRFNAFSQLDSLQLFRRSVQERQRSAILHSLQRLENNVLSARSSTQEEAKLRLAEAELIMKFIDRAKEVEPLGQVVLNGDNWRDIRLEDDDRVVIPSTSNLVMIQGEVNFPNTQVFNPRERLSDYIQRAGGFTRNADRSRIILLKANGEIIPIEERRIRSRGYRIQPGDELIILPKIDRKFLPIARDLTQILFNLAVATKVVLDV